MSARGRQFVAIWRLFIIEAISNSHSLRAAGLIGLFQSPVQANAQATATGEEKRTGANKERTHEHKSGYLLVRKDNELGV